MANTKQDCRYGANCRDISDPTHRNRFRHPSETSSAAALNNRVDQSWNNSPKDYSSTHSFKKNDDDDMQTSHSTRSGIGSSSIRYQQNLPIAKADDNDDDDRCK